MPDRQVEDIVASGSFSGVSIPTDTPSLQPLVSELPTSDATAVRASKPIQPVGPDDSGVSDAPTRLREAEGGLPASEGRTVVSGSRSRSVDQDTRIYGGSIRPSRIAPWLVSLGLAAVLLFVLAQLFQPLFNRQVEAVADLPDAVAEASSEQTQEPSEAEATAEAADAASEGLADESETRSTPDAAGESTIEMDSVIVENDNIESGEASSVANLPPPAGTTSRNPDKELAGGDTTVDDGELVPAPPSPRPEGDSTEQVAANAEGASGRTTPIPPPPQPQPPMESEVDQDADQPQPMPSDDRDHIQVATLLAADSLTAALVQDQWIRLKQDSNIVDGVKVFCAPTFRSPLSVTGGEVTLIGPSQVEWVAQDDGRVSLWLEFGRLLVASTDSEFVLPIQLGDETIELRFAEPDSVAAVEVHILSCARF